VKFMERKYAQRAVQLLQQVLAAQATTERLVKQAVILMQAEASLAQNGRANGRAKPILPFVDHDALSIRWQRSACNLGATIPLRLFDRLCRRPNCFVCHESLLQDVWQGARKSKCTVRSTVRRLKRSLEGSGMAELARSIRCQGGSYALMLGANA
jgi:hypothetical protein